MDDVTVNLREIKKVLKNGAISEYVQQKELAENKRNRHKSKIVHKKFFSVICPIKLGANDNRPQFIPHSPFPRRNTLIYSQITQRLALKDKENISKTPTLLGKARCVIKDKVNTFKEFNKTKIFNQITRRRSIRQYLN